MDQLEQQSTQYFSQRLYMESIDVYLSLQNYMDYVEKINERLKAIPEMDLEPSMKRFNSNDAIKLFTVLYHYLDMPNNNGLYLKVHAILLKNFGNGVLMNAISHL